MHDQQTLHLPPQNLEVETALIGSVLLEPSVIDDLPPSFRPEHFYRDSNRIIYQTVLEARAQGKPIDSTLVIDTLEASNMLGRIGGRETIDDAMVAGFLTCNAPRYASIVQDSAMRRDVIALCREAAQEAQDGALDAEDVIQSLQSKLFRLEAVGAREGAKPFASVMRDVMARVRSRIQGDFDGVSSGLPALDYLLGGLAPKRLILIAGRPAMGKTALAMNIAEYVGRQGMGVYFVSLEMGATELGERVLAGRSQIPGNMLRDAHRLRSDEIQILEDAAFHLESLPMPIDDTPGRTIGEVSSLARRMKSKEGLGLIVVDYVQLLEPDKDSSAKRANRQEQVSQISRRLKALAREIDVPVIALSQLNRASEAREDKKPLMSDLRESGSLEQDADQVLLIHRPDYYKPEDRPGVAELIVAKNRGGSTGTVHLAFDRSTTTFRDLD